MCDDERAGWVPSETHNPHRDFKWWDTGVNPPATGLQADGNKPQPRLLGPDGKPAPRTVHRIGFQPRMVTE